MNIRNAVIAETQINSFKKRIIGFGILTVFLLITLIPLLSGVIELTFEKVETAERLSTAEIQNLVNEDETKATIYVEKLTVIKKDVSSILQNSRLPIRYLVHFETSDGEQIKTMMEFDKYDENYDTVSEFFSSSNAQSENYPTISGCFKLNYYDKNYSSDSAKYGVNYNYSLTYAEKSIQDYKAQGSAAPILIITSIPFVGFILSGGYLCILIKKRKALTKKLEAFKKDGIFNLDESKNLRLVVEKKAEYGKKHLFLLILLTISLTLAFVIFCVGKNLMTALMIYPLMIFSAAYLIIFLLTVYPLVKLYSDVGIDERERLVEGINTELPSLRYSNLYLGNNAVYNGEGILIPYADVAWIYKKITNYRVSFLPFATTELVICSKNGKRIYSPIKNDEEIAYLLQGHILPASADVLIGYGDEQQATYKQIVKENKKK